MADTRRDKRAPISLKVRFKSATLDEFIEQYCADISRGGIFIKAKSPMAVGTLLKFEFQLKDESRLIHGVGRVVWKRDPAHPTGKAPGMGIKFIKMDPESRALVDRMVASRGDQPGRYDEGELGTGAEPQGSFFPTTSAPSELPAPEDRTQVRHASEFLASALATGGSESVTSEAEERAAEARRRTEEIEQARAVRRRRRPRIKKTLAGVGPDDSAETAALEAPIAAPASFGASLGADDTAPASTAGFPGPSAPFPGFDEDRDAGFPSDPAGGQDLFETAAAAATGQSAEIQAYSGDRGDVPGSTSTPVLEGLGSFPPADPPAPAPSAYPSLHQGPASGLPGWDEGPSRPSPHDPIPSDHELALTTYDPPADPSAAPAPAPPPPPAMPREAAAAPVAPPLEDVGQAPVAVAPSEGGGSRRGRSYVGLVFFALIALVAIGILVWLQVGPSLESLTDRFLPGAATTPAEDTEGTPTVDEPAAADPAAQDEAEGVEAAAEPEPDVEPMPAAPPVEVQVESVPRGATIAVAGEERGTAPVAVTLPLGQPVEVRARLAGHQDQVLEVTATESPEPLRFDLAPMPYVFRVEGAPEGALVRVVGGYSFEAPGEVVLRARPRGRTVFEVRARGYETRQGMLDVADFVETDGRMVAVQEVQLESAYGAARSPGRSPTPEDTPSPAGQPAGPSTPEAPSPAPEEPPPAAEAPPPADPPPAAEPGDERVPEMPF